MTLAGGPKMKISTKCLLSLFVLAGTIAFAKDGVTDPIVKARMELMDANGANIKFLWAMVKGQVPFDASKAAIARTSLINGAAQIEEAFEQEAYDPVTVVDQDVWTNWPDFIARANALEAAAKALDATSLDGLKASIGRINDTCASCHVVYKI
jgi:cytochrome c556